MTAETRQENKRDQDIEKLYFTVDSYANGVSFGRHRNIDETNVENPYLLSLELQPEVTMTASRFEFNNSKEQPLYDLERHLMGLSRKGILRKSVIYFGTITDPFHPFDAKFDVSMKMLDLFRRYQPGMLHVQTRSPLLVLAMPVLQALGKHVAVTIGLETHVEQLARRFTPDLPGVSERLKTVRTLRRFGIEVCLQVAPVLPYGDWKKDAAQFAEVLVGHSDSVVVAPLCDGTERTERMIRGSRMVQKLAQDRLFHWLRKDAAYPLLTAIEKIAPEHLREKERQHLSRKQLDIFAA